MDEKTETAGADWVNAALLGGNWNNGANSGSRCSNWNNAASNSNNNIGSRFACYDTRFNRFGATTVRQADPFNVWSADSVLLRETLFTVW